MTRHAAIAAAFVGLVALGGLGGLAGCGDGDDAAAGELERVPEGLVPEALAGGSLRFYPSEGEAKEAFANAPANALIADGRLWELREGERLVGALQLTTVLPDVDLRSRSDRQEILGHIIPGAASRLDVGDTPVWLTASEDKVVYVWFGRTVFQVLQLKGSRLDAEAVITELIGHQTGSHSWDPIPYEDYERD